MRANTGYGPIHIRAELGTHGLDSGAIAAAMTAMRATGRKTPATWCVGASARRVRRTWRSGVRR